MEIIETTNSLVENLYLLSGPLLLISIVIGIFQLKASKQTILQAENTININSTRDSIKLAIEQYKYIQDTLIPLELNIMSIVEEKELKFIEYKDHFEHFTLTELESFGKEKLTKYLNSGFKNREYRLKAVEFVDKMNMISVPFNALVADDKTGFQAFGKYYCGIIKQYYPLIAMLRKTDNDIRFNDIKTLYNRWNNMKKETAIENE
jgi:hypothetical protein